MLFLFSVRLLQLLFSFHSIPGSKIIRKVDNGQENLSSITDDKAISMVDQSDSSEINRDQIDVPELDEKIHSLFRILQSIHPSGIHPPPHPYGWVCKVGCGRECRTTLYFRETLFIQIPPRAFVDKDGKVEGNVEINFREYTTSRIFSSVGSRWIITTAILAQLESAGMMELVASKDNVPLYVNPKNKINVMLASVKNSNDYNLYYFDRKKNEWVYKK